jgi:hypothetical protein
MGTASLASQRGEGIRFPSFLLGVRKAASSLRAQSSTNMNNRESSERRLLVIQDEAIPVMRAAVDHLFRDGGLLWPAVPATGVLVETLLDRGAEDDVAEADAAIERLAAAAADEVWRSATSGCCGFGLCWRGHTATPRDMPTSGIATAKWPKHLATRGISPGLRRCHNGAVQRTQTAKRIGVYCRDIRALVCFGRLSEQADRKVGQIS